MLRKFKQFIVNKELFAENDPVLLAVSGGMDSVVMSRLFYLGKFTFGIAHCNFGLRGKEADLDEELVRSLAKRLGVPFYTIRWNTEEMAKSRKQSVQLCARELRYHWLEEIRVQNNYSYIATAHHLNDSLETLLYNLTKGCGIRGLGGIPVINGNIIRPLLFADREEIEQFQKQEALEYREDSSNQSDKYARNLIRNQVVPILKKINPSLEATIDQNIRLFREAQTLFDFAVEKLTVGLVIKDGDLTIIQLEKLLLLPAAGSLLYEILAPFGFNSTQVQQIMQAGLSGTGKEFYAPKNRLLLDRGKIMLRSRDSGDEVVSYTIEESQERLELQDGRWLIFKIADQIPPSFSTSSDIAYLDFDKLSFPLLLRKWQTGDRFQPLGMNGKSQSLQDFFTNNKLSRLEKEAGWILESDNEICWVVGYRIDERFKVREDTRRYYQIRSSDFV